MAFVIDNKKMARNTIALYLRMALTMAIGFFTTRVTLQQLGVEDFGLNNLVGSIVSMFSFLNGTMGTAVQRFYSYEIGKGLEGEKNLKRIFATGLFLHIIIAIITFVIAELFAFFFLHKMNIPDDRLFAAKVVFQISIVSLVINIINVPYAALLRAREMFDKTAIVEVIQAVLRLCILYMLIIVDFDKLITFSLLGLGVTLFYVGTLTCMARSFDETHSFPICDRGIIKQMLAFISMLIFTVLCQLATTQGMVLLINVFFGLVINAAYAVALQVSHIVNTFAASFKQSMIPQMMAAYGANDLYSMHRIINVGTKITFLLMLMITVPIITEADFLLKLWLKTPPQHASFLVVLVLIQINISSFTYFQYQGVHASGRIKAQQIMISCCYLINIILIYAFFNFGFAFQYAVYINMIISVLQCVINLFYSRKEYQYNVSFFTKSILIPCCILVVLCAMSMNLVTIMIEQSWKRFIFSSFISEILIVIFGYIIIFDSQEKKQIKSLINRIKTNSL